MVLLDKVLPNGAYCIFGVRCKYKHQMLLAFLLIVSITYLIRLFACNILPNAMIFCMSMEYLPLEITIIDRQQSLLVICHKLKDIKLLLKTYRIVCPGIRILDNGKSLYIVHQEDKASALDNSSQPKQSN